MAYDLENLLSPLLAAALLTVISFHWLFSGTSVGFVASALLVVTAALPRAAGAASLRSGGIYARTTRGIRIYLATPRLRGLLAVTLAAAAGSAMVIVNTVVIVRGRLGLSATDVAFALAAYGAGSILAAVGLPAGSRWARPFPAPLPRADACCGVRPKPPTDQPCSPRSSR